MQKNYDFRRVEAELESLERETVFNTQVALGN